MDPPLGSANVSSKIRWRDLEEREKEWEALWEDPEWNDLWSRHPGFEGYLQLSVRFLDEVQEREKNTSAHRDLGSETAAPTTHRYPS